MNILADIWDTICTSLLPRLEECLQEPLIANLTQLVGILEIVRIEEHRPQGPPNNMGRKREDRSLMARAFVAKALYNLPTTQLLIENLHLQPSLRRICGFAHRSDIPSAATFSRAFAEFAEQKLADSVHAALVATYVGNQVVMHISRDATEIQAREKPAKSPRRNRHPKRSAGDAKRANRCPNPC